MVRDVSWVEDREKIEKLRLKKLRCYRMIDREKGFREYRNKIE